jgi:hypothetical protein
MGNGGLLDTSKDAVKRSTMEGKKCRASHGRHPLEMETIWKNKGEEHCWLSVAREPVIVFFFDFPNRFSLV